MQCSLSNAGELWEGAFFFFFFVSLFTVKQNLKIKQLYHVRTPATFKEVGVFQIIQQELDQDKQS